MPGAASRKRATSSGLKTTGGLRGSWMNDRCLVRSGRSSVTLKKNRSAATVALIFGVPAPLAVRCSRKRRTSSASAVPGEEGGQVLDPLHVVMLGLRRELADRHVLVRAPAQGVEGLLGLGDAPVLSEVDKPPQPKDGTPPSAPLGAAPDATPPHSPAQAV